MHPLQFAIAVFALAFIAEYIPKETEQEETDAPDTKNMASKQDSVYMEGIVDNYMSNCGFIKTSLGEEYYFSPRSVTGGCVSRGAKVRFIASRKPNLQGKTINERRGKAYNVSVMAKAHASCR